MILQQEKRNGMARAPASPQTQDKRGHGPGKRERAHTQTMLSPKMRWNVENESPKAHVSFTPQELNEYQNVQRNQSNVEAMANA